VAEYIEQIKQIGRRVGVSDLTLRNYEAAANRLVLKAGQCNLSALLFSWRVFSGREEDIMDDARESVEAGKGTMADLYELSRVLDKQKLKLLDSVTDTTAEKCSCKWVLPLRRRL